MSHASYLHAIFCPQKQEKTIRKIKKIIRDESIEFDGFIVTGVSGVAMGAILARSCKKSLVVVRKPSAGTHSGYDNIENIQRDKKYIFVDDLIASGETFERVKKSVIKHCIDYAWDVDESPTIIGQMYYAYWRKFAKDGIGYHAGNLIH